MAMINLLDEQFNLMRVASGTAEGRATRDQMNPSAVVPTCVNRRTTGKLSKPGNLKASEMLANDTVDAYPTNDYNMVPPDWEEQ